jgi:hypothetical protein
VQLYAHKHFINCNRLCCKYVLFDFAYVNENDFKLQIKIHCCDVNNGRDITLHRDNFISFLFR